MPYEGMPLPEGPIGVELVGFRRSREHTGAVLRIRLSREAFEQLASFHATGAVKGENLTVTTNGRAKLTDDEGDLDLVEVVIGRVHEG